MFQLLLGADLGAHHFEVEAHLSAVLSNNNTYERRRRQPHVGAATAWAPNVSRAPTLRLRTRGSPNSSAELDKYDRVFHAIQTSLNSKRKPSAAAASHIGGVSACEEKYKAARRLRKRVDAVTSRPWTSAFVGAWARRVPDTWWPGRGRVLHADPRLRLLPTHLPWW